MILTRESKDIVDGQLRTCTLSSEIIAPGVFSRGRRTYKQPSGWVRIRGAGVYETGPWRARPGTRPESHFRGRSKFTNQNVSQVMRTSSLNPVRGCSKASFRVQSIRNFRQESVHGRRHCCFRPSTALTIWFANGTEGSNTRPCLEYAVRGGALAWASTLPFPVFLNSNPTAERWATD